MHVHSLCSHLWSAARCTRDAADADSTRRPRGAPTALIAGVALLTTLAARPAAAAAVPPLDHVIVVVMENHSYDEVRTLPYIATLLATYTSFSQSYAVTHPSEPNYLALWAASTMGTSNDNCPPTGSPYTVANLGSACQAAGRTWKSYCENLPSVGSTACTSLDGLYARKHQPCPDFSNLSHTDENPYAQLAVDIAAGTLPALAFVVPNLCDDMHDCSTSTGDAWLAANLPLMITAVGPRGLVILTWDEDDGGSGNHILTVFAGPAVKAGYVSSTSLSHYTVVRTICDALGLAPFGNASSQTSPTDVWNAATAVAEPLGASSGLGQPAPNPFRAAIATTLTLSSERLVHAFVVDCSGRRVRNLYVGVRSGTSVITWDGRRDDGRRASAGLYFLRVTAGRDQFVRRLALVK